MAANDFRALLHVMVAETAGSPLTAGELRQRMGMSGAAITYLVERMIASGHFRRESDPADRRKVILRVADDGMDVARGFFTPLAEHTRQRAGGDCPTTTSPPRTGPSPRSSTRCVRSAPNSWKPLPSD